MPNLRADGRDLIGRSTENHTDANEQASAEESVGHFETIQERAEAAADADAQHLEDAVHGHEQPVASKDVYQLINEIGADQLLASMLVLEACARGKGARGEVAEMVAEIMAGEHAGLPVSLPRLLPEPPLAPPQSLHQPDELTAQQIGSIEGQHSSEHVEHIEGVLEAPITDFRRTVPEPSTDADALFDAIDSNNDGVLDRNELASAEAVGMMPVNPGAASVAGVAGPQLHIPQLRIPQVCVLQSICLLICASAGVAA